MKIIVSSMVTVFTFLFICGSNLCAYERKPLKLTIDKIDFTVKTPYNLWFNQTDKEEKEYIIKQYLDQNSRDRQKKEWQSASQLFFEMFNGLSEPFDGKYKAPY